MNWSPDAKPASGPVSGVTKPIVIVPPLLTTEGPALAAGSAVAWALVAVVDRRGAGVDAAPPRAPIRLPAAAARAVTPVMRSTVRRENLALQGDRCPPATSAVPSSGSGCAASRTAESGSSPAISLLPRTTVDAVVATPGPCAPPGSEPPGLSGPDGRGT